MWAFRCLAEVVAMSSWLSETMVYDFSDSDCWVWLVKNATCRDTSTQGLLHLTGLQFYPPGLSYAVWIDGVYLRVAYADLFIICWYSAVGPSVGLVGVSVAQESIGACPLMPGWVCCWNSDALCYYMVLKEHWVQGEREGVSLLENKCF